MNEGGGSCLRSQWLWVAVIASAGLIISTWIFTAGLVKYKSSTGAITVTGSAKKEIISDWVVWSGSYSFQSPSLTEAYKGLVSNRDKVKEYFLDKGIPEQELIFSSVFTSVNKVILPNGQYTNQVESYLLSQTVEIRSKDVEKVTQLSRGATEIINQGVEFQSNPPQFFYTKIADLKVEMLTLATKDAFNRAEKIAENAQSRLGTLRSAKQGVFQITPRYSNEVSDYGINDTSSKEKEITAVVNCSFTIQK
jgi:hypothetical protein